MGGGGGVVSVGQRGWSGHPRGTRPRNCSQFVAVEIAPPQKIPVVGATSDPVKMELVFASRTVSLIDEERNRIEALAERIDTRRTSTT